MLTVLSTAEASTLLSTKPDLKMQPAPVKEGSLGWGCFQTSVEESEEVSDHYPEPVHIKEEVIDPELEPGRIAQDVSELGAIRVVEDTTELQSSSEIHCKRKMPEAQRLTCRY